MMMIVRQLAMRGQTETAKTREPLFAKNLPIKFWAAVGVAGLFDSSANVFFLLASRVPGGTLTVVSVLTALYPLGTIILARVFLKEKIALVQQAGILLALAGSALLALA
jgi:drug/metabolite transporter (DMT)-like permease